MVATKIDKQEAKESPMTETLQVEMINHVLKVKSSTLNTLSKKSSQWSKKRNGSSLHRTKSELVGFLWVGIGNTLPRNWKTTTY